MQNYFIVVLLSCFSYINAQDISVEKELDLLDSEEAAKTFMSDNEKVKGKIFKASAADIDKIQQQSNLSDNVVEIVTKKMNKLSDEVKACLKLAACLGYRFDETMLFIVKDAIALKDHNNNPKEVSIDCLQKEIQV